MFLIVPDPSGKVAGFTIAPRYPLPQDMAAGTITAVEYRLPFDGLWLTYWGGLTELENYHAVIPAQRHAYDFVVWNDGATFRGDGSRNADYYAWGQPALAPVDGTVVAVENGMPDMPPGSLLATMDPAAAPGLHPAGNHVIIRTVEDAYGLVAHLQEGSVVVRNGDRVAAGDPIGLTGNSGRTSEPHIHVHVQNVPDFFAPTAIGLPLRFADYRVNGEPAEDGIPVQGEFVESIS
jgi:murein DD-endopeptidase MepM/ murein hydrolase activator NlpD